MVFKKGQVSWNKGTKGLMKNPRKKNIEEDVWKHIDKKGEDDCWEWMGYKNQDGYGQMKINYKTCHVHRLVYKQTRGSIPNKICVLHTCDNPSCCNPKHLWLGNHDDNMRDKKEKGRGRTGRGEKHGSAKLTERDVLEIKEKYLTGKYSQVKLGEEYAVNRSTIYRIIYQKCWKYI